MKSNFDSTIENLKQSYRRSGLLWTISLALQNTGLPAFRCWPEKKFSSEIISRQTGLILQSMGMEEDAAEVAAGHINYADIHGIESHGCSMLRTYHQHSRQGSLNMASKPEIIRQNSTTALIDGGGGLGHMPSDMAMKLAIEKCRESGMGAAAVRNSGHFGAAGSYVAMAADKGLVGIAMTSILEPAVVPTHGVQAMLGTNPIAFSAPASRNRPFLLDMATSIVPTGKLFMAWRKGKFIPRGWAFNHKGRSLRNPYFAMNARRLAPLGGTLQMGGHKGYGLASMVEILSAILPGCLEFDSRIGHFFLTIDPGRFGDISLFRDNTDDFIDSLRASQPQDPNYPIQVAGDPEYEAAADRMENGIPLTRVVIEDIRFICDDTGATFLLGEQQGTEMSK